MSRRSTGGALDSQPSASTDQYASAEELDMASLNGSRAASFSGRRSTDMASRTSSASGRGQTSDTASSPDRVPSSSAMARGSRSSIEADAAQAAVAAAAEQLQGVSLEQQRGAGSAAEPPPAVSRIAAVPSPREQCQGLHPQAAAPSGSGRAGPSPQQPLQQSPAKQQWQQPSTAAAAAPTSSQGQQAAAAAAASGSAAGAPGAMPGTAAGALQPPGASLFSVPMTSAPTTGIFGIPQEMFRIRDLDAGKEYSLDQRYWIKDMDTGTVYVLDPDAAADGNGGAPEGGRVTELLSGKELSVNDFEDALGFFKVPQPAPPPHHVVATSTSGGGGGGFQGSGGGGHGGAMQHAAQKSLKSFSSGATWVKANMGSMLHSLKSGSPKAGEQQQQQQGHRSASAADEAGGGGGGSRGLMVDARGGSGGGGGAGQPLALDDKQGQPVKVQVYRKSYKELTDLRLVQQLGGHQGVVWTMKFSRNGRFLATAGQDCVIRAWQVAPGRGSSSSPSSPVESDAPLDDAAAAAAAAASSGGDGGGLLADPSVAVFQQRPYRVYSGHKQDVLDLCWSKTQFLLSASMDKTVRLWHISMDECLRVFKHTDFVTAIDFHPLDDKMFLSGSIDGKVRLWNIPEQRVVSWQDVHEMVTAITYSPDGRKAVVGTMKGKCRFYTIEKSTLEYEAQLDVKNTRGQHSRGKKITGLAFLPSEPGKLLITSNDSRVRLYDGYTLRCKYKGHTNRNTQIRASFSPSGDYITCGSDDGWVYVWGTRKSGMPGTGAGGSSFQKAADNPLAKEKNASYECFQANGDIVTVAVFAPASCHRSADSMSPTGEVGRHQRSQSLGDKQEGEAALATGLARGQVLVTAGYTGEIRVYENIGLPQWL